MPQTGFSMAVQLAASAALSLSIFALPWWTLSRPVPTPVQTYDDAANETRIVVWSSTVELDTWATAARPLDAPADSYEPVARTEPATEPAVQPTSEPSAPPSPESSAKVRPETKSETMRPVSPAPVADTSTAPPPQSEASVAVAETSGSPNPAPTSAERTRKRRRSKKKDCRPDVPEIRSTGKARWEVDRDFVDHYARNLDEANRLAHVSWARNDEGEVIGIKVNRVRCGSPLHEAGFQSGDVVTRINGRKVRSIPQALAAYVALRVKRTLHVRGTRSGHRLDLRYRLT